MLFSPLHIRNNFQSKSIFFTSSWKQMNFLLDRFRMGPELTVSNFNHYIFGKT